MICAAFPEDSSLESEVVQPSLSFSLCAMVAAVRPGPVSGSGMLAHPSASSMCNPDAAAVNTSVAVEGGTSGFTI